MTDEAPRPVVWITGAAGGLGRAMVDAFLEAGFRVAAGVHRRNPYTPTDTLWPVVADVTSTAAASDAAGELVAKWGRVDVLVNNAGITRDALLAGMSPEDWTAVMDVNLRGAFLCVRAVVPAMTRQRSGHIINISSFAARRGRAGQANYVASKAAMIGLTQALARELGPENIRVNAILPGVLPTAMVQQLPPEKLEALAAGNTLGRLNDCAEVARFIRFLATLQNVSGQVFQLDSRIARWT